MPYLTPARRTRPRKRYLGDATDTVISTIWDTTPFGIASNLFRIGEAGGLVPGGGVTGVIRNAATGTLSQSQASQLVQTETQNLVAAGMDPASAASQAQSDVTDTLVAAGADPSQSNLSQIADSVSSFGSSSPGGISVWIWIALGGAALFFLAKEL